MFADDIENRFSRFGPLEVHWPDNVVSEVKSPPKGYAFILFEVSKTA